MHRCYSGLWSDNSCTCSGPVSGSGSGSGSGSVSKLLVIIRCCNTIRFISLILLLLSCRGSGIECGSGSGHGSGSVSTQLSRDMLYSFNFSGSGTGPCSSWLLYSKFDVANNNFTKLSEQLFIKKYHNLSLESDTGTFFIHGNGNSVLIVQGFYILNYMTGTTIFGNLFLQVICHKHVPTFLQYVPQKLAYFVTCNSGASDSNIIISGSGMSDGDEVARVMAQEKQLETGEREASISTTGSASTDTATGNEEDDRSADLRRRLQNYLAIHGRKSDPACSSSNSNCDSDINKQANSTYDAISKLRLKNLEAQNLYGGVSTLDDNLGRFKPDGETWGSPPISRQNFGARHNISLNFDPVTMQCKNCNREPHRILAGGGGMSHPWTGS
jgi:hypothetical protein